MFQFEPFYENSQTPHLPLPGRNSRTGRISNSHGPSPRSEQSRPVNGRMAFGRLIGRSAAMQAVFRTLDKIARTDVSVLLHGETGTGKELVARALHEHSARRDEPFIAVNCAALTDSLLESELFGHERGAFTGAVKQKPGRFELAHGGTLFLDEVGEMPLATQVKLLRVLQERTIERVGGTETISVDFRVIAATNRNLTTAIRDGRFRQDLFYRLNVMPVNLAPLRARVEDITLLAEHFLARFSRRHEVPVAGISPAAVEMLESYSWPGNVRELEHVIERAVVLCTRSRLDVQDLLSLTEAVESEALETAFQERLQEKDLTQLYARMVFQEQNGNKKETCRILGINYRTLLSRLGE